MHLDKSPLHSSVKNIHKLLLCAPNIAHQYTIHT